MIFYRLLSLLARIPILGIIARIIASPRGAPIVPPARVLGCDLQPHYEHAEFECPDGWTETQVPDPRQFPAESNSRRETNNSGERIATHQLTIARYWVQVIEVPTVCNNTAQIQSSTTVEQATEFSAGLESEMVSAGISVELKNSETLGYNIDIGQPGKETRNALYQRWSYVLYKRTNAGVLSALAWALWGGGTSCEEDNQPESVFVVHVCERDCSPDPEDNETE